MKPLTLVLDAPVHGRGPFNGTSGEILGATIRAVVNASGQAAPADLTDILDIYYVSREPTPGNKPPKIAVIRAERPRLMAELEAARPTKILSVGAAACASMSGTGAATPITKWRGQMRMATVGQVDVPWVATISPGSVAARTDLYRDLSQDVWKAWTQPRPLPPPDVEIVIPSDFDALRRSLALLDGASVVSCDVETTGLRPHRDQIISVGFGADYGDNAGVAVIVPRELLSDDRVKDLCWDVAYSRTRRTVFQNGKYDMAMLAGWFEEPIPREALVGDTLLLGYLCDERPKAQRAGSLGLKEQASYRYDQEDYHWVWDKFYADMAHDGTYPAGASGRESTRCDDKCPYPHPDTEGRADWDGLYGYHALDVYYTTRLWFDLVDEANSESPRLLACHDEVLIPAAKALAACELAGAPLDYAWIGEFSAYLRRRIDRRERILNRVVREVGTSNDEINIGSAAQVADLMYDDWGMTPDVRRSKKTKQDGPDRSTDKEHIEAAIIKYVKGPDLELRRAAKWLRMLLRWRGDTKNLSTYSETLVARSDEDGRVRAGFLIHGTSTGRLSSSEPNLQNIPAVDDKQVVNGRTVYTLRGGKKTRWPARRAFAPPPGYVWVEADYSQLELRVAAWLSKDERLIKVFVDQRDIHREVASTMFSKPADEITKPERYLAKAVDFGILYGRTAKALADGAEMDFYQRELGGKRWDEPTAQAFISKFLRGYPQLGEWLEEMAASALTRHYVETPFGRRRRFPFTPRTKGERNSIARQAQNTPIQSAASDLCLLAMSRLQPVLPDGVSILLPVHDSICAEVRNDLVDEVYRACKSNMEIELPGGVPLTIDFEVGTSWADVAPYEPTRSA